MITDVMEEAVPEDLYQQQVRAIEQACDALLSMEVRTEIACRLQKRYVKHREHLFVFLTHPGVPFDNNGSERALRNSVVHRKVIAGFRSDWGARAFAVARSCEVRSKAITTVIETVRKKGCRIFEVLHALLGPLMPFVPANRSP